MFEGVHVFVETRNTGARLDHGFTEFARRPLQIVIEPLVVHQRSGGSLTVVDLGADRLQIGGRKSGVLDGLLAAVQDAIGLLEQIGNLEWRPAGQRIATPYIRRRGGSK